MTNGVDYTIYLQPVYLEVTCPHCKERLIRYDGDGVDFEECYSDESEEVSVFCDECCEEFLLGNFKEVAE